MGSREFHALRQLATLKGILVSYIDAAGQEKEASPETLLAVLKSMGMPVQEGADVIKTLAETRIALGLGGVPPVAVAWIGRENRVPLRMPARWRDQKISCQLELEDGTAIDWSDRASPISKAQEIAGEEYVTRWVLLPGMVAGYHRLQMQTRRRSFETLILAAPVKTYADPEFGRKWGVFLPVYATHSNQSWGAGNLTDWRRLSEWVGSLGGNVVATLPLLTAFLDYPKCEPGPYSPASRLFWNEFFIDVAAAPEFAANSVAQKLVRSSGFQKRIGAFVHSGQVQYAEEMSAKRQVLELLSRAFFERSSSRREVFEAYRRSRPHLDSYAQFRAACEQAKQSWHGWPERQRGGRLLPQDYSGQVANYYRYAQWLAQEQIDQVLAAGRELRVKSYLDLPLGVNSDSFDLWRERRFFCLGASAGAPPDPFFSKGQDWGFAPLHPQRLRELGYKYVQEYLRFQMRHTQLLRIDHVMGLHRLFWVPHGLPASQGAYVRYPADELYALLSIESHRHQTMLIGENLGTVPPEVNAGMERHRLGQMFVVQYEQKPDAKAALRVPPVRCVASLNTHDMPTFSAHWKGLDIADRIDLGLILAVDARTERANRKKSNAALVQFLQKQHCLPAGIGRRFDVRAVLRGLLRWLSASPAELVLINLEDLWLEESPQNVPGTSSERPNWQHKAKRSLEAIQADPRIRELLMEVNQLRGRSRGSLSEEGAVRPAQPLRRNHRLAGQG